jgi:hypothetical protein
MSLKLINKKSTTPGAVPAAADLLPGEIAVNVADKKWFTKTAAGAIVCLNFLKVLDGGEITDGAGGGGGGGISGLSNWVAASREFNYSWSN